MSAESRFIYLNHEDPWARFTRPAERLVTGEGGELTLAPRPGGGYVARGLFAGGPFRSPYGVTDWRRLIVRADPLPERTHLQLFTLTSEDADLGRFDLESADPFPGAEGWQAAPRDAFDLRIDNPPGTWLYVGGILWSSGRATPVLHQIRVEYGEEPLLEHLPELYSSQPQGRFLRAFLGLHGSLTDELDTKIDGLPRLFDPQAAPTGDPAWLEWLAGWLAFDLAPHWREADARTFLAEAFELYGLRGTLRGLRRYIRMYTGITAHITEPDLRAPMWSLERTSRLGFSTRLAPAHIQGAVVDSSASLDRSHLSTGEKLGAAVFDDLAHRFCVHVYCSDLRRPGALEALRRVLDREKPAHTIYAVRTIEPKLQIGVQARIGIDAIVAGGPDPARLGEPLGATALAEPATPYPPGIIPQPAGEPNCEKEENNHVNS